MWINVFLQVFSEARIFFSLDGERYQQTPLYYSLDSLSGEDWYRYPTPLKEPQTPSDQAGAARNVTIPLQNRVGRYVRMELDFASRWLLLSEAYFDSGKCTLLSKSTLSSISHFSLIYLLNNFLNIITTVVKFTHSFLKSFPRSACVYEHIFNEARLLLKYLSFFRLVSC